MDIQAEMSQIKNWKPDNSQVRKASCKNFPVVIKRTPTNLIEECQRLYDAGFIIGALSLVLTIPDVCSKIAKIEYKDWCARYLGLPNPVCKCKSLRNEKKTQKQVDLGFRGIRDRGLFTCSDLWLLRCAVIHGGNSLIDGGGKNYSPFKAIGVIIDSRESNLVKSWGHTGVEGECESIKGGFDCTIGLTELIRLISNGVAKFIEEDTTRNIELSNLTGIKRIGIVDYRSLEK